METSSRLVCDYFATKINNINTIHIAVSSQFPEFRPNFANTPGPLYNMLRYKTVLDITLIFVGPQLDYICYVLVYLTLIITWIG